MRPKTLVAESRGFADEAAAIIRRSSDLVLGDLARPELLREVRDADVLWIRLRHRVDEEMLDAAPRLRAIVSPTTGLTHIDTAGAARRGVLVLSLQKEVEFLKEVRATAEHTVGLALALTRKIPAAVRDVCGGEWRRDLFKGHELFGKTVGVVGYGRLGRIVARYFHAFGMEVLATDPRVKPQDVEPVVSLVSLEVLLTRADIVTIHISYTWANDGFFDHRKFSAMKQGSWLINTSRGEVVDEGALLSALRSGKLRGAALDVIAGEPVGELANHPLVSYAREHDTLVLTPHIGGCTEESMKKAEVIMAQRLAGLFERWG